MKILAVISQKGGSGKSTLAVHLAGSAVHDGKAVALIDIDKQQSAYQWFQTREKENELISISAQASQLPALLQQAETGGVDLVVIDTAPHTEAPIAQVAELADFVLVPTAPYVFELRAVPATIDTLNLVEAQYAIVVNNAPPRGRQAKEAADVLNEQGFSVLESIVCSRVAFRHALADGQCVNEFEPQGKAAAEIGHLYNELKLKM